MRWEDERYVRFYTRDTPDWLSLSFEAQSLMGLIMRKVDRAGILPLGRHGKRAVAIAIGHAHRWETIGPALEELIADGCVGVRGETLFIRNFIEAQEAAQSDAQRKRESRAKARDVASAPVTFRDQMSQPVTDGHNASQVVTPSLAVPSVPGRAEKPPDAQTGAPVGQLGLDGIRAMGATNIPIDAKPEKRKRLRSVDDSSSDPRFQGLKLKLVEAIEAHTGAKYGWQPGDPAAIKRLIGFGDDSEVLRRLGNGLKAIGFDHTATISQLAAKWNQPGVATGDPPVRAGGARETDIRRGRVRAEDQAALHTAGGEF